MATLMNTNPAPNPQYGYDIGPGGYEQDPRRVPTTSPLHAEIAPATGANGGALSPVPFLVPQTPYYYSQTQPMAPQNMAPQYVPVPMQYQQYVYYQQQPTQQYQRTASEHDMAMYGGMPVLYPGIAIGPDFNMVMPAKKKLKQLTTWTPKEDKLLRELKEVQKLGWREISLYFPDRTPNACQFRWRRIISGTSTTASVAKKSHHSINFLLN